LISKLTDLNEGCSGFVDNQLKLRQVIHVDALNKVTLLGGLEPTFLLGQDTAGIEVLKVLE